MSEWRDVWSESIQALAHDPLTGELRVRWANGKVSVYSGVDEKLHDLIRKSPSVGSAIWGLRRAGHPHRYEDEK